MRTTTQHHIQLGGRRIDYRVIHSPEAQKLRVRVGPNGVDVVKPKARNTDEIIAFLDRNTDWLMRQIERAERLGNVRRSEQLRIGEILYRGEPTTVRIETPAKPAFRTAVHFVDGNIVILQGRTSPTPVARMLELWLRRQARQAIEAHLSALSKPASADNSRQHQLTVWPRRLATSSKDIEMSDTWFPSAVGAHS